MTRRYTPFRLILLFALFVVPLALRANGDPENGGPATADSLAAARGHCNPLTIATVNCATRTITLSAYVSWTFTGQLDPYVATWNTGQTAQTITVVPPGTWNWDASGTGCEQNHWNTDYNQPGAFFNGNLQLISPGAICAGGSTFINVNTDGYTFNSFIWSPPNINSNQLTPYEIYEPGNYSLTVTDDIGCPFVRNINIPLSPPVQPTLSGPQRLCTEGNTGTVQVNQSWSSYEWSEGQTTNPITVDGPGLYSVTVTNQFGCTGVGAWGVQSAAVDDFPISMTAPAICVGQLDTLRVVGGFSSYQWSNNVSGITNIVTNPGTYFVTVTNIWGCTGTGSVTVAPLPTPSPTLAGTPLCPGDTATLVVGGGIFPNYAWSNGATGNPINVLSSGTYSVTVSGAGFCATSTSLAVAAQPAPDIDILPPNTLNCVVPQTDLDATNSSSGPNFSLNWSTVGGHFVSGDSTLLPVVDAPGSYILVITNTTTGCVSRDTVVVNTDVVPPPAPVGPPGTLNCAVTTFDIGPGLPPADTALVPIWTTVGGNFVSGHDTWAPTVDQPGTYILTVTNPVNSCTSTASVVVSQDILDPNAVADAPDQLTCTTNTVTLDGSASSAGPNFTYLWTTANGTIVGDPTAAISSAASVGTYNLLVTNIANGCTSTASAIVTADVNIPTTSALPPATLTCNVGNVTIDATASTSGPTFTYTWTGPNPNSIVNGQGTLQPTVNAPGTYSLVLFNTANSCSATLSVNVPQDIVPPVASAGPSSTLNCVVPTLDLDGTASSTGANFTYQWSTANGNIVSGAQGLTPTVDLAGSYVLVVSNTANGCTSSASVQILNDASAPVALIDNPATLTCATLQTIIDATASSQGADYQYTWSGPSIIGGQGTLQPTVDAPGVYTLDIVNTVNGCTDTQTIMVPQDVVPPVAVAGNDGIINCTAPTGTIGSASNPTGSNFTLQWSTTGGNFTSPTNGPTATVDAPGTYTLLITNTANGCTDTDAVVVQADFAPPTVDAGPTDELTCVVTSTVLQGTGDTGAGFLYQWTTTNGNIVSGANTLTPTVNLPGLYNLLITNTVNGCQSTDDVTITISADVPTVAIAAPPTLTCVQTSLDLNGTGTTVGPTINYTWSTNNGNIVSGGNTLAPTVNAPGTYILTVVNTANNCTSFAPITVSQNIQDPVVDAGNPSTLTCTVLTSPLQATILSSSSPNISYVWTTTNGNILNGANTPTPTVNQPGLYTVVVTDAINGCTHTDNVQINQDIVDPTVSIAQPATLTCVLSQTPINATASSPGPQFTYQWTTPNGTIVSGSTTNMPTVSAPGTYNLLVTNTSNGCTETGSTVVPQDIVPPTAIAGPTVGLNCVVLTNSLDGTGTSTGANFVYNWTTADGQIVSGPTTLNPIIGDPGTYVLTVLNTANGCQSTSSVVVTEDVTLPSFSIAQPQQLTCVVQTAQLAASGTNFGSAPTFTWTTTGGNIVGGGSSLNATVNAPGTYVLTIVNTVNGCTQTQNVQVQQNIAPPPLQTQPVPPLNCTVFQRTLQATAPAQALLLWTTQNGNIVSGANTPSIVVNEPGDYMVIATLPSNGCTSVAMVSVEREQNVPTGVDLALDPPKCNGVLGLLEVEQVIGGYGPYQYSIDGGTSFFPAQDIDGLKPGTYDLVIRDANGCTITQTVPVPVPPTPAVTLPPSFKIELGDNQELEAVIPPSFNQALIDQVIWTPVDNLTFAGNSINDLLNPVARPFVTTEYKVTILTKEGCAAEARTIIRVDRNVGIYPPNVIWPESSDGNNFAFTLYAKAGTINQINTLQVYDRWGEQLWVNRNFLPNDPNVGWKGDFRGQIVNPGVFVWWAEVELIDGQVILMKGDVTVVR